MGSPVVEYRATEDLIQVMETISQINKIWSSEAGAAKT
jgi:hypothetical protein